MDEEQKWSLFCSEDATAVRAKLEHPGPTLEEVLGGLMEQQMSEVA